MFLPGSDVLKDLDDEIAPDEPGHPRAIMVGFTLVMLLAAAGLHQYQQGREREARWRQVAVLESRLCLGDDERPVQVIDRDAAPLVKVRLTLRGVPVGEAVPLDCQWIDPAGRVAISQRYRSRPVEQPVWSAYAEQALPRDVPTGQWAARLLVANRELCRLPFEVRGAKR